MFEAAFGQNLAVFALQHRMEVRIASGLHRIDLLRRRLPIGYRGIREAEVLLPDLFEGARGQVPERIQTRAARGHLERIRTLVRRAAGDGSGNSAVLPRRRLGRCRFERVYGLRVQLGGQQADPDVGQFDLGQLLQRVRMGIKQEERSLVAKRQGKFTQNGLFRSYGAPKRIRVPFSRHVQSAIQREIQSIRPQSGREDRREPRRRSHRPD